MRDTLQMPKNCDFLESHPKISNSYLSRLRSHPQHSVAKKQMDFWGNDFCRDKMDLSFKTFLEKHHFLPSLKPGWS